MTPDRCSACPGPPFRVVPSIGPTPARVLFLGAGPGESEQKFGKPYVGLAGEEFTETYLTRAGLRRGDVAISNGCLCWNGQKKIPEVDRVVICAKHHLPALLDKVKPEVVVLMGGVTQHLADTRYRLDFHRGVPQQGSLLGKTWEGVIFPLFEPALGMRETSRMSQLLDDFRNLGRWLRGEWEPPVADDTPNDYQLLTSIPELMCYLRMDQRPLWHAADTETHGGRAWSVQFSNEPHTGRMILAERADLLECYQYWLREMQVEMILHNAGQDLDTLERMRVAPTSFIDTMQMAYHACSLPQGLKPLAYRLLGVTMRSWSDVVYPASVAALTDWMEEALAAAETSLQDVELTTLKVGRCGNCGTRGKAAACKGCGEPVNFTKTEYKMGAMASILRHVLTHTGKTADDDEPYDPWKALDRMSDEGLRGKKPERWEWSWLTEMLGPTPELGIGNCDLESAVTYGCGDADMTGRVAEALAVGRGDARWAIDEADADV